MPAFELIQSVGEHLFGVGFHKVQNRGEARSLIIGKHGNGDHVHDVEMNAGVGRDEVGGGVDCALRGLRAVIGDKNVLHGKSLLLMCAGDNPLPTLVSSIALHAPKYAR